MPQNFPRANLAVTSQQEAQRKRSHVLAVGRDDVEDLPAPKRRIVQGVAVSADGLTRSCQSLTSGKLVPRLRPASERPRRFLPEFDPLARTQLGSRKNHLIGPPSKVSPALWMLHKPRVSTSMAGNPKKTSAWKSRRPQRVIWIFAMYAQPLAVRFRWYQMPSSRPDSNSTREWVARHPKPHRMSFMQYSTRSSRREPRNFNYCPASRRICIALTLGLAALIIGTG